MVSLADFSLSFSFLSIRVYFCRLYFISFFSDLIPYISIVIADMIVIMRIKFIVTSILGPLVDYGWFSCVCFLFH